MTTLKDFTMTSIAGDDTALSQFENQVCLIVNVATK
jgi:glutathione peroxidase-family protein